MSDPASVDSGTLRLLEGRSLMLPEGFEIRTTADGVRFKAVDYHSREALLSWRMLTLLLATQGLAELSPGVEQ